MNIAPSGSGSRIEDLGDRLVVRFRPRRSWGVLAFMLVWLAGWTAGGVTAFGALFAEDAPLGGRAFLLLWLCGWAFGEGAVVVYIAWALFGVEILTVAPDALEVRRHVGRFARTKRYDVSLVTSVEAARTPSGEDERARTDFCLKLRHADETVYIGERLGEREAEYVASLVATRINPSRWWQDDAAVDVPRMPVPGTAARGGFWSRVASVAFPLAVVAVLVLLGVEAYRGENAPPDAPRTPPAVSTSPGLPDPKGFSDPSQYAGSVSAHAIASSHHELVGPLRCTGHSWTNWSCTARVRAVRGGLAGRTYMFECHPTEVGTRRGPSYVSELECGMR